MLTRGLSPLPVPYFYEEVKLIKRWDNAAHHPEIKTFPHHLHDGAEDSIFPYTPIALAEILKLIPAQVSSFENQ